MYLAAFEITTSDAIAGAGLLLACASWVALPQRFKDLQSRVERLEESDKDHSSQLSGFKDLPPRVDRLEVSDRELFSRQSVSETKLSSILTYVENIWKRLDKSDESR